MLEWSTRSLESAAGWAALACDGVGATVFHEPWFLRAHGVEKLLCVHENGALVAGLPLWSDGDPRILEQSTLSVPYGGPVFAADGGAPQRCMLRRRRIMAALAEAVTTRFDGMRLAFGPEFVDLVPFLQRGFLPELRYTYVTELAAGRDRILAALASGRRNDLARARRHRLELHDDPQLRAFDVARAVRWAPGAAFVAATEHELRVALAAGRGRARVALHGGEPVAGLFCVWDRRRIYTTHAYTCPGAASLGAATLLYVDAMEFAATELGVPGLDFDGSVLPGVEAFYQSFGGRQTVYFKLHWHVDPARIGASSLYDYS